MMTKTSAGTLASTHRVTISKCGVQSGTGEN